MYMYSAKCQCRIAAWKESVAGFVPLDPPLDVMAGASDRVCGGLTTL